MSASHPDPVAIAASFSRHRAEPDISAEAHIRRLRIALGESLIDRHAIYLDTNYWVWLRDAHLNRPKRPIHAEILAALRELVASRKSFCPLNASTFVELLRQTDPACREATAELVDELSLDVALADEHERMGTEIAYLIYNYGTPRKLHSLHSLVWTRLPLVLGTLFPRFRISTDTEQPVIQKAFVDYCWSRSMTELVKQVGSDLPFDLESAASRLNEANDAHAHELRSFKDTYRKEIEGTLDLFTDVGIDVIEKIFEESTGEGANSNRETRAKQKPYVYGLLVAIAGAGKGAEAFPTLHAHAKCHAANRWDQRRRLDANTLMDFHHAIAAVVYCDAFFTDAGMRTFLMARHVALDREFACTVVSDEMAVLDHIRAMGASASAHADA